MRWLLCTCGIVAFIGGTAAAETAETDKNAEATVAAQSDPEIEIFIGEMVRRHGFKQVELESIFGMAQFQPAIIKAISQPATSRPWHEYRPLFVNPRRIAGGVDFWKSHAATLERARKEFGIPEEIIAAVIGVETAYGIQTGKHRVLDALITLAFGYPKRVEFFRNELEQYLLLGREQNADVLNIRGSYAGAIGIPQFMPSSYRRYALDFDGDGKADLSGSTADAIGSVANYLKSFGWETEQTAVVPALVNGENYHEALFEGRKPTYTLEEIRKLGAIPRMDPSDAHLATLVELVNEGGNEYWLGFNNFFVITRYNRSVHYAMSVFQLAEEIRAARNSSLR